MFTKISLALFVLVLVTDTQCRSCHRHPCNRPDGGVQGMERDFSQAVNDFGISLYKELAPDLNLVLAPVSALTTLSMVMLGAVNSTEQNLFQGLKLQPLNSPREVHQAFQCFTSSLSGPLQNITFDTANAVYHRADESINREFIHNIIQYYNGEIRNFNFSHPQGPEAAINEWVEMKTRGQIQNFLSPGDIQANTLMWLLNAVYFQGTWEWIFDEKLTRPQNFTVSPAKQVEVDMMHNDYNYSTKYNSSLEVKVLELPYAGDRFSFFILLPDSVGLANLESNLDYNTLESLLTHLDSPRRYQICVPKFKVESTLDLVSPIQALGVTHVFQRGVADLSGINGQRNLYVDKVKQKAVLEVNERGTVAAAATGVRVTMRSLPPQFIVNRPFMYVLRDKSTATNLFIGRFVKPAAVI